MNTKQRGEHTRILAYFREIYTVQREDRQRRRPHDRACVVSRVLGVAVIRHHQDVRCVRERNQADFLPHGHDRGLC